MLEGEGGGEGPARVGEGTEVIPTGTAIMALPGMGVAGEGPRGGMAAREASRGSDRGEDRPRERRVRAVFLLGKLGDGTGRETPASAGGNRWPSRMTWVTVTCLGSTTAWRLARATTREAVSVRTTTMAMGVLMVGTMPWIRLPHDRTRRHPFRSLPTKIRACAWSARATAIALDAPLQRTAATATEAAARPEAHPASRALRDPSDVFTTKRPVADQG